jgi:DNA polymerase (family 10)
MLREIGGLLGLEPGNRFRAQAYARGAAAIAAVQDLDALVRRGELKKVAGIGSGLARTIEEIVRSGRSELLETLRARYPPGAAELSRLLTLDRIRALHDALGITTLAELRAACDAGRVRGVRGFGEKTERQLAARIERLAAQRDAVTLAEAARQGEAVREALVRHTAVVRAELAGAYRRRMETIDRLDVVVASDDPDAVVGLAARLPGAIAIVPGGDADRVVVQRPGDLDVHLRVARPNAFGAAWIAATGSAAHVDALAHRASTLDLTLDDRGLRRGRRAVPTPSEEALYGRLGLAVVPPELREDGGELDVPEDLVRPEDVRGAVHCHTVHSDGKHTIEEMARAAEKLGFRYLTITDHSPAATYAHGLDLDRLRRQWDEIARVQERVSVRLLRGTESDILRDGALDHPDAILRQLDVVIASIHNRHGMDAGEMTRRLVRAFRHPVRKIWGHALGRYVLTRPPFACDMEVVLDAVAASGTIVEVNGDPHRLDLEPRWLREASRRGIRFVVSSDAHSTTALRNVRWGVDMARRGRLRRRDVLNTLGPEEFAAAVRP